MMKDFVFCGTVVHATVECPLEVLENAALAVKNGKVVFLDSRDHLDDLISQHQLDTTCVTHLGPRQWLMPGLVDCHLHSPQLSMQGVGTNLELLDWLQTYTFPTEARYSDAQFARSAHAAMVRRTLRGGTTLACYFSSIHLESSLLLCQTAEEQGQRALVGKVNMDMSSPDYYRETTQQSVADTERFVAEVLSHKSSLVTPVITPRFAISCSESLMTQLAQIARQHHLPVQTHLNETPEEIKAMMQLFPGHETYTDLYDAMGLLGPKTILAHCVHMTDRELDLLLERGSGVVHCACSNTTLRSGLMDIRRQLDHGVKMGLGSDVGAGYTTSILAAMRHSVDLSNVRAIHHAQNALSQKAERRNNDKASEERCGKTALQNGSVRECSAAATDYQRLTMDEAFRLATLGGSDVLGQNCGNFEPGREFDAILVDPEVTDSPLDLFHFDSVTDVVHKFLYHGDDRNMVKIFVQGKLVVDKTSCQRCSPTGEDK